MNKIPVLEMDKNTNEMKKIFLLLITLLMISTSCNKDENESVITTTSGEQEVEMNFSSPITYSSSVADEKKVVELDLVVVKGGVYQYTRSAYASTYAKFRSILKVDEGVDIHFLANCRSTLTSVLASAEEGETLWSDIEKNLILTATSEIKDGSRVLPMWGFLENVTIDKDKVNTLDGIELLRAVATAHIKFEENPAQGYRFKPEVAYVYFGADKAFLTTPKTNIVRKSDGTIDFVKDPIAPEGMKTNVKSEKVTTDSYSFINSLFMFDNPNKTDNGNRPTRIVVGGKITINGVEKETFFPLDLHKEGKLLPVTRNVQYIMNVTSVNSEGWSDPDVAAEQYTTDLDYDVVEWTNSEDKDIAVDGPNYLSISSRYAKLYRKNPNYTTIYLTGTYTKLDIDMYFSDNSVNKVDGLGTITIDQDGNALLSNKRFDVKLSGESTNLILTISTKADYSSTNEASNKDILILKAGRIEFDVQIEQVNSTGWNNGGNEEVEF